jgi:hypothetical protein
MSIKKRPVGLFFWLAGDVGNAVLKRRRGEIKRRGIKMIAL